MVVEFATDRINRTAGIVMKTFFRNGKEKMKNIKEDYSRKLFIIHAKKVQPSSSSQYF